jgi:putative ABC transport system permease protein
MSRLAAIARLAWLGSVRQPARTCLGIVGVAAVGALLFDMLLLSRGLVLSFHDLLDRVGFDVRVLATETTPLAGPPLDGARALAARIAALPQVDAVITVRIQDVDIDSPDASAPRESGQFIGTDRQARPMWTILDGHDLSATTSVTAPLVVNRNLARLRHLSVGSTLQLRSGCNRPGEALPPASFTVVGIAEFPFDDATVNTMAGRLADLRRLCGNVGADQADMLLARSSPPAGPETAAAAIRALRPDLYVVTNDQIVERFSHVEFSYFRQMSFVLATVTLFFGFLLIAVLLTVSVNQRLGELAALRALGLSRARVMAGVLGESVLVVGTGGLLALPAGEALSVWLDAILRALPGIPTSVSFFVFEPRVLVLYVWLLAAAAAGAALYPMRIVSTLPIAATLRREVVS